jgi:protein-tyrosine phosphatase
VVDLDWLTPDLAISGCFDPAFTEQLARRHRIAAVIDVRAEACDDEHLLRRHGIALLHLPTEDHCAIAPDMLDDGVRFAHRYLAAGHRVLVHCEHGIGRSALLALCVLVAGGMEPITALALAKSRRERVSPSVAQYEAWASWLRAQDIAAPEFSQFALIAYSRRT